MMKASLELRRLDFFDRNRSNRGPLQKGKRRPLPLFADVSFLPEGKPLVSAGSDGAARLAGGAALVFQNRLTCNILDARLFCLYCLLLRVQ